MYESKRTVVSGVVLASIVSVVLLNIAPMTHSSVGLPEYNSGWTSINQGEAITLTHNLGTTNVSIEMWGNDSYGNIHQRNYGGEQWMESGYDSGWVSISSPSSIALTHNLGTKNVMVYMMGRKNMTTTESPYIHQKHYGGEIQVGWSGGVFWRDLTETTIDIQRIKGGTGEDYWNYVRVMIWKVESLGSQGDGSKCWLVSSQFGAYWDNLTDSTIDVYRALDDQDWEQVCVRIWKVLPPSAGVGGFWIPVDKFSLLAPYIALVATVILAVSISVAIIKYRKKQ